MCRVNVTTKVEKIMTSNLIVVNSIETVNNIDKLFADKNIHHVPVVSDDNNFLGLISKVDVEMIKHWGTNFGLAEAEKQNKGILNSMLAKDIMKKGIVSVRKDNTLGYCADLFNNNNFHSLPVIEDDKIVGIVTTYDMINFAYDMKKCVAVKSN